MASAGVRNVGLGRIVAVGLSCILLTSCGDSVTGPEPAASFSELFGPFLVKADGSTVDVQVLEGTTLIGIYFASRSCPACAGFTPQLVSVYNELRGAGESFEVVFASADGSSEDLLAYMQEYDMGWLAVPFEGGTITELARRYDVQWIPTLIVIDSERETVSMTGREDILDGGAAAFDDWVAASQAP